jgi:hypothetical protein
MNYSETAEFTRDFKKLLKKFPSLSDDMEITKRYRIEIYFKGNKENEDRERIKEYLKKIS